MAGTPQTEPKNSRIRGPERELDDVEVTVHRSVVYRHIAGARRLDFFGISSEN